MSTKVVQQQVVATDAAVTVLRKLRATFGEVILIQSGGCCDGSSPICLREGELLLGSDDVRLGDVDGVPFYCDREQYERWGRPRLVLDAAPGSAEGFSLEALAGIHFRTLTPTTAACDVSHR